MLLDYFTYLSFTVLQHARTYRESFAIFLEGGKFINSYFKILSRIIFFSTYLLRSLHFPKHWRNNNNNDNNSNNNKNKAINKIV